LWHEADDLLVEHENKHAQMCAAKQNKMRKKTGGDDNDSSCGFKRNNFFNSYEDLHDNDSVNQSMADVEGGWSPSPIRDKLIPPLPEFEVETNQLKEE
jgi:hypothetical protein